MTTDLLQHLRTIASSLVPDPRWADDPDNSALLELVAELDLTNATEIEQLLPDDPPWTRSLARALAARSLPEPIPTAQTVEEPSTPAAAVGPDIELSPEELLLWSEAGISRPETAQRWAARGFGPASAGAWYDLDLRGPEEALQWIAAGFTPATARQWVDILDDPPLAASFVAAEVPSEVAGRLNRSELGALAPLAAERGITWAELRPYLTRHIELRVALLWLEHRRRHPLDISWAFAWATQGLSPRDSVEWPAAGFRQPAIAAGWRAAGFDPVTASAWVGVGVPEPNAAAKAAQASGSPEAHAAWIEAGVPDPGLIARLREADVDAGRARDLAAHGIGGPELRTIAEHGNAVQLEAFLEHGCSVQEYCRWSRAGFGPAEAAKWLDHGVHAPTSAQRWSTHGFGPPAAQAWGRAGFEPKAAAAWAKQLISLHDAERWSAAGIANAATARAWIDAEFTSPIIAERWKDLGVRTPGLAREWADHGFSLMEATPWLEAGIDVMTASAVRARRLSAKSVRRFVTETRQPPKEFVEWLDAGMNLTETLAWCAVGIDRPQVARRRRLTSTPDLWKRLLDRGMTTLEIAQIAGSNATDGQASSLARRATRTTIGWLREQDVPVRDWVAWLQVCGTFEIAQDWIESDTDLHDLETIVAEHDLDPRGLGAWTSAGFGPSDVLNAHEAGFTSPKAWQQHLRPKPSPAPTAVAEPRSRSRRAAAAPEPAIDPFDEWLEEGENWFATIGVDARRYADFFRMIFDEGLEWADPDDDVLGVQASEEWLGEIQERAVYVSELLRKEPHWPKVFESEEITIVLDGTGEYPLAWVGVGSTGGLVCFGADEYEVYTAATNDSWRYMAGAAISWFIDCCIVIRLQKRRLPFNIARRSSSGTGLARAAARYAPRPTFAKQYDEVRRGVGTSPRAHLVDGHPRKLPPGWQPSDEARDRAPARKRHLLKPNETWVSPYLKGGEYARELKTYLSKYSALADAMAFADQDAQA